MTFDSWMKKDTRLSDSSVLKYHGAIKGALSDWASEAGIIQGAILDITHQVTFDSAALKIRELPIFKQRNETGNSMYSNALNKYSEFLAALDVPSIGDDIEDIISDSSITATEKTRLVNARIGQGQYRKELISYWGQCAVTGYADPSMLVASHIKPWAHSTNAERLDKFNGLLLIPNLDRAFDQGLISFTEAGEVLISSSLENPEKLGINELLSVHCSTEHHAYMEYHRQNIFISA